MELRRVVVTGMDIVSPLGTGIEATWANILAGKSGAKRIDDFEVDDDYDPSSPYEEMFDPAPPRRRFETAEEQLGRRKDRPGRPQMAPQEPPAPSPASPQPKVEPAAPPAPSSKEREK